MMWLESSGHLCCSHAIYSCCCKNPWYFPDLIDRYFLFWSSLRRILKWVSILKGLLSHLGVPSIPLTIFTLRPHWPVRKMWLLSNLFRTWRSPCDSPRPGKSIQMCIVVASAVHAETWRGRFGLWRLPQYKGRWVPLSQSKVALDNQVYLDLLQLHNWCYMDLWRLIESGKDLDSADGTAALPAFLSDSNLPFSLPLPCSAHPSHLMPLCQPTCSSRCSNATGM